MVPAIFAYSFNKKESYIKKQIYIYVFIESKD
jgi:hypothetical protein